MAHYFDSHPDSGHQQRIIKFSLAGRDFVFETDKGVFSRGDIDFGTRLLLETVIGDLGKPYGRLLDLGCGYGPVGIVLKRVFPHLEVAMSDINNRALSLARKNALANQVKFVEIIESDGLADVPGNFDLIVVNPPIRAGKKIIFRLYAEAMKRLRPGGALYIVIQKKQGAASTEEYLLSIEAQVDKISRSAGYWVLRARRGKDQ